jgi:Uma2 family endonuclease
MATPPAAPLRVGRWPAPRHDWRPVPARSGAGNAFGLLLEKLDSIDSPCRPFTADIATRVPTGNLRRPDVAVYCPPFDEDAMVSDRPRLLIEVLSESTEDTDQHVKVDEYQRMAAVDYIILIAPHVVDVLVWARADDRSWQSMRYQSLEDVVPLPRLGVSLALARLYRSVELRPRPRLVTGADDALSEDA